MQSRKDAYIDLYVSAGEEREGLSVRGRALEGKRPHLGKTGDRKRQRLVTTWRLFETDELSSVDVEVQLELPSGLRTQHVQTDDEGFFKARFEPPLPVGKFLARARLTEPVVATDVVSSDALVHSAEAGLGVVSDMDDTVLETGVSKKFELIRKVLLATPEDLQTFEGAPELFQSFAAKGHPIMFVSGSPANLEPRLRAFLELRGFPTAPMLLKDLGIGPEADSVLDHQPYKLRRIREVFDQFPRRRFLLIGDSGEHDPEIYRKVQTDHPDRVAGVFIHRVGKEKADDERFKGQRLFESYSELLAPGALPT
ncbi:MAG: phosphatase domain-containing protein [Myxococcaceae bacterium]